jgi:hypothetical protein
MILKPKFGGLSMSMTARIRRLFSGYTIAAKATWLLSDRVPLTQACLRHDIKDHKVLGILKKVATTRIWREPPIIVARKQDGQLRVLDGHHRSSAARHLCKAIGCPPLLNAWAVDGTAYKELLGYLFDNDEPFKIGAVRSRIMCGESNANEVEDDWYANVDKRTPLILNLSVANAVTVDRTTRLGMSAKIGDANLTYKCIVQSPPNPTGFDLLSRSSLDLVEADQILAQLPPPGSDVQFQISDDMAKSIWNLIGEMYVYGVPQPVRKPLKLRSTRSSPESDQQSDEDDDDDEEDPLETIYDIAEQVADLLDELDPPTSHQPAIRGGSSWGGGGWGGASS